jgi:hypothetical protein
MFKLLRQKQARQPDKPPPPGEGGPSPERKNPHAPLRIGVESNDELVVPDPPLTVKVVRWDGSVHHIPARQAISHVTGTAFKDINVLKRELRKRKIKLSTGLRKDARVRELSRRLEKAILTEQAKEDIAKGRDKSAMFKERLKLIDEANVVKNRGLMDAALLRSDMLHATSLISRGSCLPNYTGPMEFTPLIRAAFVCDVEAIQRMVQLGADPDFENRFHESALLWACTISDGHLCVSGLLGGAFNEKNVVAGAEAEMRKKAMTADVNKENRYGVLPLFAAAECGNLKTIKKLIDFGATVTKANRFGLTALMVAARFGHEEACYCLLQNGAELEKRDKGSRKAELWAREAGFSKLADVLKREAWRWAKRKQEEEEQQEAVSPKKPPKKGIGAKKRLWRVLRMRAKALRVTGDWQVMWDGASGKEFYYNATTDVSQWDMPESLKQKAKNTWHEALDSRSGATYYYNDAGDSTYTKPLSLDDAWKRQKAAPTTAKEIQAEMDSIVAAFDKDAQNGSKKVQPFVFTLPELSLKTDGYIGVARIKSMARLLASDRISINKQEWDKRRGALVGKKVVKLRCLEPGVRCEFCAEAAPMVICVPCDTMFCMDCMRSSAHSNRYPHHRCKLVSQVTKEEAVNRAKAPDPIRPESRSKIDAVEIDDDSNSDESTDGEGCNDDARMPAKKSNSKRQQRQRSTSTSSTKALSVAGGEEEEGDQIVLPPQPKDREYRKTMAFEVDRWKKRNEKISKVVKPALAAHIAMGGYAFEPPTPRERRIAEELRLERWKNDLYAAPKEHEVAMFLMGLGKHDEAIEMLEQVKTLQEKRLGVDAPAIAVTMANLAKVQDESGRSADATASYLRALDQLPPGHKKYNKILDGLAHSMIHNGLAYLAMIPTEALAAQHRLLPIANQRANRISERWNRQRMVKFDEDALEKPISLTDASSITDVMSMLNSDVGIDLFEKFSRTENQQDLVIFWKWVNRLQILARDKDTFNIEEGEPRDIVHDLYSVYIKSQKIKCITVKQYRELMQHASTGEIRVAHFLESQSLIFNVIREGMYRRFLVSRFGGQYLWSKTLTERLRRGLIKAQALMRKTLAIKRVVRIRALRLRVHQVNLEIERIKQKDIRAATVLQKRYRGWVARKRVREARKKIKRLHLLHLYVARKRRVVMAMRIQTAWNHCLQRWPAKLELRRRLCIAYGRRWNQEEEHYYYWDFRKKKVTLNKPRAMGDEEVPLRVVCQCENNIVTRYCIVCKGEPECDECYFKRHGTDDLTDDIAAAKVLGTASFAMAIPMHRHGWLQFTTDTTVCNHCKVRYAVQVCQQCASSVCKQCQEEIHAEPDASGHDAPVPINFRLHYRGIEDLDSDEEGAYRGIDEEDEDDVY